MIWFRKMKEKERMKPHFEPGSAGRLISRGHGRHSSRVIDSWELILVLESELEMFVGEKEYTVRPGECLLLPPGIRHGGLSPYTPNLSFFWIHLTPRSRSALNRLRAIPRHFPAAFPARLSEYFQLYLSRQNEAPEDRTGLALILALILHEAGRKKIKDSPASDVSLPDLAERAKNILTLRFREPLSTSQIAKELQCNPDYLGRLYRRYRRETLTSALLRIRLAHAEVLLRDTMLTVAEVAYETGFSDPGYFRQCFFRKYAVSPRAYRNLKRRGHINTE